MADELFENPILAALYDGLHPDRSDLEAYVAIVKELQARTILDIGCGTGTFAVLLARNGFEVTGIDPAFQSLEIARKKPYSEKVSWIHGDASDLPPMQVDLVIMTGNVAQAIVEPEIWKKTLLCAYNSLHSGGYLVFESRDPANCAWKDWNREQSYKVTKIDNVGQIESWVDILAVNDSLVSFRWTFIFDDGTTLTSDSTLRFRERNEIEKSLVESGYVINDIRDAPDRPGKEFVFIARRQVA